MEGGRSLNISDRIRYSGRGDQSKVAVTQCNFLVNILLGILQRHSLQKALNDRRTTFNWWFTYDVIKNMMTQIMINFFQIIVWPVRPYNVSVPNLYLFRLLEKELSAKEVSEFSIML